MFYSASWKVKLSLMWTQLQILRSLQSFLCHSDLRVKALELTELIEFSLLSLKNNSLFFKSCLDDSPSQLFSITIELSETIRFVLQNWELHSSLQSSVLSFEAAIIFCLLKSVYFETDSLWSHLTRFSEKLLYESMNSVRDDQSWTLLTDSSSCSCDFFFFFFFSLLFFSFCLVINFRVSDVHAELIINITTDVWLCHKLFISDSISKAISLLQTHLCLHLSAVLLTLQCLHLSTAHMCFSRVSELMCRLSCRKSLSWKDCSDRSRKRLWNFVSFIILKYKQI